MEPTLRLMSFNQLCSTNVLCMQNHHSCYFIMLNPRPSKCIWYDSILEALRYVQYSGLYIALLHSSTELIWSPLDQWNRRNRNAGLSGLPQGDENTLQGASSQYEIYLWSLSKCQWGMGAEGGCGGRDPTHLALQKSWSWRSKVKYIQCLSFRTNQESIMFTGVTHCYSMSALK